MRCALLVEGGLNFEQQAETGFILTTPLCSNEVLLYLHSLPIIHLSLRGVKEDQKVRGKSEKSPSKRKSTPSDVGG